MMTTEPNPNISSARGVDADTSNSAASPSGRLAGKRPAPLACVECRGKHLKCDGDLPCARCRRSSLGCLYQKSRRGYKGPRRSGRGSRSLFGIAEVESAMARFPAQGAMSLEEIARKFKNDIKSDRRLKDAKFFLIGTNLDANDFLSGLQNDFPSLEVPTPQSNSMSISTSMPTMDMAIDTVPSLCTFDLQLTDATTERAINAYYHFCHPSHPFLPPQQDLTTLISQNKNLLAAMCFIASSHVIILQCDKLFPALQQLTSPSAPKTGFTVQSLLLYSIGLNAQCRREEAADALTKAINMALEIGMHRQSFAPNEGQGSAVMEESWRRTFWELYCVDGTSAGALQGWTFVLYNVLIDVFLPCEKQDFSPKRIPTPRSLKEYDEAPFAGQDTVFSSFTYRIDAIRNLGKILSLPTNCLFANPAVHEAQMSLANWRLHLPPYKEDLVSPMGEVDEMLFQAKMITNASIILLHKPFSRLYTGSTTTISSCGLVGTSTTRDDLCASRSPHCSQTIQGANAISDLITLPTRITSHTPFFTCVVVVALVVHMAQWASCLSTHLPCPARQHLQLDIGALKGLSGAWPLAQTLLGQVQGVVAEVFAAKETFAAEQREGALEWGDINWDGDLNESNISL